MVVLSKFLAPGKTGLVSTRLGARSGNLNFFRVHSGSSYRYLNTPLLTNLFFRRCSSVLCKTCPCACPSQIVNHDKFPPFCKAFNVIYKITCNKCPLQYIGHTSTPLHVRINTHRSDINLYNPATATNSNAEFHHFNIHNFANTTIEILHIQKSENERLFLESTYINQLNTIYPYGLNQLTYNKPHNVFSSQKNFNNYSSIYSQLNLSIYTKTKRSKRGKSNNSTSLSNKLIKNDIKRLHSKYLRNFNWLSVRKFIFAIKKKHLFKYFKVFQSKTHSEQFNDLFFDLIFTRASKLNVNLFEKPTFNSSNTNLILSFCNPILSQINFNTIIKNTQSHFPIKDLRIAKSFKYPIPLGRQIFNYNKFSKTVTSSSNFLCRCNDPNFKKFIDTDHGHVITGDLNLVQDSSLRYFMKLGTKFRLPSKFNPTSILNSLKYDLDYFIYKLAIAYNKPVALFHEWKFHFINHFSYLLNQKQSFLVKVSTKNLKNSITELQSNFIITYVDKAPNNYAFICKSYYHSLLNNSFNSSDIFKLHNEKPSVKNSHISQFHRLLKIPCKNLNYPYLVLIPKFHKNPIKFRSVTVGCNTYNNSLNKILLNILSQIYDNTLKKNNTHCLKNSFQLVTKLKKLNNVINLKTLDFKDLFNNINLKDLSKIIQLLFMENYNDLTLRENINAEYFKSLSNFILFHNYLKFNNKLYKQIQGIPQGGAASSLLADLFLYYYERQYINSDLILYRYVDDIILININTSIPLNLPISYPAGLEYTEKCLINSKISFLDLNITLSHNKLLFDLYDKRNDFNFNVNTFTDFNSCLHISVYRNILINHLFRINNLCSPNYKSKNLKQLIHTAAHYHFPCRFIYSIIKP